MTIGFSSFQEVSSFFITDKMPANFMWLGLILCALPEAKIIHLNRDPIATCWSIYKTYFSKGGNGYSYNIENLCKYYSLYKDLMTSWNNLFAKTFYEVSYEKLTEDQCLETKNLLNYCGLEWNSNCLDFHVTKRTVNTASNAQVRRKMYSGSSSEWKHYEKYIKPLINALD